MNGAMLLPHHFLAQIENWIVTAYHTAEELSQSGPEPVLTPAVFETEITIVVGHPEFRRYTPSFPAAESLPACRNRLE